MISYYTSIVFITVFSMFIMILGTESNSFMPFKQKRNFEILFLLLTILNLLEWIGVTLNGTGSSFKIFHVSAKFMEFSLAPIVPIACVQAISGNKNMKFMKVPIIFNILLQIYSLFTNATFFIDSQNIYHRGTFYFLYIFLVGCNILFLIIDCFKFSQQYQCNNVLFLVMIMMLIISVMFMQITSPELRVDWTCTSIAAIMMYIYYYQLVEQVDDMTSMLNRRSFNCTIEGFNKQAAILFFDVDKFKYANDTYGHSFGDKCLIRISTEIRKSFEKYGYCYRYGGDEFCVIMTRNIEDAQSFISNYLDNIESIRENELRLPSVSVGYVLFDPDKESIHESIKRADKIMYKFKEKNGGNR